MLASGRHCLPIFGYQWIVLKKKNMQENGWVSPQVIVVSILECPFNQFLEIHLGVEEVDHIEQGTTLAAAYDLKLRGKT